ncbi:hypothetical protein NKH18_48800 [Streptomyces sp. M10(2022)]
MPGIDHRQHTADDGIRTIYMLHTDGSWARATATGRRDSPAVHQGGPRRLWDELDRIRTWLAVDGDLPIRGATVTITPTGRPPSAGRAGQPPSLRSSSARRLVNATSASECRAVGNTAAPDRPRRPTSTVRDGSSKLLPHRSE